MSAEPAFGQPAIAATSINSPRYNLLIARAKALTGLARYHAFAALDRELTQRVAPVAVYGVQNDRQYVSARTGCYHHHPVYGFDLPSICLRRNG